MEEYMEMIKTLRFSSNPEIYQQWMSCFLEPLGGSYDTYGNYIVEVGQPNGILFSAHTDTQTVKSKLDLEKPVVYFQTEGKTFVHTNKQRPLGADDTNGVWILRSMILQGYPATYVFHKDEEVGCLGSSHIASHYSDWLSRFQCAIAIDRKGYTDVITHMIGISTCTPHFASYLAQSLNMNPSPKGGLTDTFYYSPFIPNCTNLSCGYFYAHSNQEFSDFSFCQELLHKLLDLDPDKLVHFGCL